MAQGRIAMHALRMRRRRHPSPAGNGRSGAMVSFPQGTEAWPDDGHNPPRPNSREMNGRGQPFSGSPAHALARR
jgi:hypothetical protein